MRLIDADSFKNFIESLPKNPNGTSRVYDEASILRFIDAQPTAYDVDAVVSEIRRSSGNGYRDIDGDWVPPMIETKDAIDIVKEGGVE